MEQEIVLELFDRYADMVYRIALSYLRSPQDAEDVVQTVFLKLLEGGMIIYPGKERAFLTKVTVNRCKNLLSATKKYEAIPLEETLFLVQQRIRTYFVRSWNYQKSTGLLYACIILRATHSVKFRSFYTSASQPFP